MKELKDYLPFYLGCECTYNDKFWVLVSISTPYKTIDTMFVNLNLRPGNKGFRDIVYVSESTTALDKIKLHLRPLSDMTEEEAIEVLLYDKPFHRDYCGWLADFVKWEKQKVYNPNEFAKLISKHFDLFGLIEDGLAIDKNKINNHE